MSYFVIVTGASSGIGEALCGKLSLNGYEVIAGVRTLEDANRLVHQFGEKVYPVLMDVTDEKGMEAAVIKVTELVGKNSLVAIVNNAGIVINGTVLYVPMHEWQKQFDVNVFGAVRTIQLFFHKLIPTTSTDRHPRRIINISSISGLFASPFMGPYASSKYALEAISDSLRRELYMYDIQVVLIQPGGIKTPIWKKALESTSWLGPEYESFSKLKDKIIENTVAKSLPVHVVVNRILLAIKNKRVRNRYLIKAEAWKFKLILMLPQSWVDSMIRSRLHRKSK